jgi:hypothetical protein
MGTIERWEEKVGRLDKPNQITDTMKAALIGKLCPKKLRDHLELHLAGKKEYHTIKQEIIRILDTGLLGRVDNKPDADKPNTMEIDTCLVDPAYGEYAEAYMNGELNAVYGKGGKGAWGKGGFQPWVGKGAPKGFPKGAPKGDGAKNSFGGKKGDAGKGSPKGKGKGEAEFQGYCSYCTLWGHTQRYCPKRTKDYWGGAKGGANSLEESGELGVEQGVDGGNYDFGEVKPLGGLGYQCTITGTHNVFGCCDGITPCVHNLLTGTPPTTTASPPPVHTITPTPVHNRYASLYEDSDDHYAAVQDLGRLAAVTTASTTPTSIMGVGNSTYKPGSIKLKIMGDSGAADCVLPAALFKEVPLNVNGPKVGRKYTAADGKHISNLGVRTLVGTTTEGYKRKIDFEVAEVTKPLASFSKITKAGHRIILDNDVGQGGYIENKVSGERTALYLENDVYIFDLYVDVAASAGFPRQGAKA